MVRGIWRALVSAEVLSIMTIDSCLRHMVGRSKVFMAGENIVVKSDVNACRCLASD